MEEMIGRRIYSRTQKYLDGKIIDIKREKYIVDCEVERIELTEQELIYNFIMEKNG